MQRWLPQDETVAKIMEALATWSRYWNEEESHHEVVLTQLAARFGEPPVDDETFLRFRQVFPPDDMLRTLTLLSLTEVAAYVGYQTCARLTRDDGLRAIFGRLAADECQHMTYFISFAKALVESGHFPAKDALAVGHFFVREGGEYEASSRDHTEHRDQHVNWWDEFEQVDGQLILRENERKKQALVFRALKEITGIHVRSADELEDAWIELVTAA